MLKNKLIAGAVFALALVVAVSANAADLGTTTLKVGSRGAAVTALQNALGVTPATGYFGSITKAKVMAFQTNHGLKADGIVGAATKAAINASPVATTGCPAGAAFNPTTGAPCTTPTTSTVPGCTAGALFSSTTGQACGTTTTPSTGVLTGAEGSITVSSFTSGTETTVGEGKSEKVLGVKVAADEGSDVAINTMKVVIDNPQVGAGESTRLERYISGVNIYQGTTKVGSADVSEFTKEGTVYSKSISLTNAVVKKDTDAKFYVEFTAIPDMSSELINNTWRADVTSIRFTDAMGVVSTISGTDVPVTAVTVSFESSTQNDKITSSTSSVNPEATTLKVSDTGTSDEFLTFAFKLKADADSSDLNVLSLPITVTTTSANVENVVSDMNIKVGSKTYSDYDVTNGNSKTAVYTFKIDEKDLTIKAGETVEVKVYAEFMKEGLASTYTSGEKATFSLDASTMVVENLEGDAVSTSAVTDRSGNAMTLSTASTVISNVTTSSTIDADGKVASYTFKFTVEADGADVTLSNSTIKATVTNNVTPSFSIKKDSGTATGTLGTSYVVADGDTASFTVTYTVDPANTDSTGTYYVTMDSIDGVSVDKTAGPETITTL